VGDVANSASILLLGNYSAGSFAVAAEGGDAGATGTVVAIASCDELRPRPRENPESG
jgi:hypothetical protein